MSLVAQVWVAQLPLECGLNLAAFRVLHKLADGHNPETNSVWRSVDRLATELGCSKRTVQRALKDLQILTFIHRGDQAMVQHLRADRRPTVWVLALELWQPAAQTPELDGVTTDVTPSGPVDNSHGVTTVVANGVTSVVALGTVSRTSTQVPRPITDRARLSRVEHADHEHVWQLTNVGSFCRLPDCGIRDDGRKRIDWAEMAVRPVGARS